ncbi:hypothetical protein BST81_07845 [Leptolyngbya sp. 'hensonii']|uniref:cyclic nucleotide-binding domain-containing protein n=1 Tax=Leptolyngbya sp. 'hensonii' TaxID=1922337 RepID=UPI00094F7B08|nr:cyclic nucleotide-binding domain-containing protein [Leptolyngbya sp. 'hensonii']OLP19112.1 hypothetical protein BST81_07845 [Leptolyngbya sp. 'hensonii']
MRNSLLILGELSDNDMEWLQQVSQRITVAAGDQIVQEGHPITALYILLDGVLVVTVQAPGGLHEQRVVAHLSPGEVIGEMSFVDHRPPSATVVAETDATLLALPQALLTQRAEADVEFGRRFYRGLAYCLSNRLRLMNVSLPQAGIEVSGKLPSALDNPDIEARLPIAKSRLETLIGFVQ